MSVMEGGSIVSAATDARVSSETTTTIRTDVMMEQTLQLVLLHAYNKQGKKQPKIEILFYLLPEAFYTNRMYSLASTKWNKGSSCPLPPKFQTIFLK